MGEKIFSERVTDAISKFHMAFVDLAQQNKEGVVQVKKDGALSFDVTVKDKGTYKIYANLAARKLYLQSPTSGIFAYNYDGKNQQWKSDG